MSNPSSPERGAIRALIESKFHAFSTSEPGHQHNPQTCKRCAAESELAALEADRADLRAQLAAHDFWAKGCRAGKGNRGGRCGRPIVARIDRAVQTIRGDFEMHAYRCREHATTYDGAGTIVWLNPESHEPEAAARADASKERKDHD